MCWNCVAFIARHDRCVIHGLYDHISPQARCDFFKQGHAMGHAETLTNGERTLKIEGLWPLGLVTKKESGYVDKA